MEKRNAFKIEEIANRFSSKYDFLRYFQQSRK